MEKVDTISDVKTKELPTGVTLYLLFDSTGNEYSTRSRDLARVGHAALEAGQHVHLEYDEKKGGQFNQFTNRYLNAIEPIADDGLGSSVGQAMAQAQAAQGRPPGLFDDAEPTPEPTYRSADAEKNEMIAKQVALKAGVEVLQYLPVEERTVSNVVTAAEFFTEWLQSYRPGTQDRGY